MRCGTCRFWGKSDETDADFRSCTRIIHDKKSFTRDDKFIDWTQYDPPDFEMKVVLPPNAIAFRESHHAVVVDGSGYYAALKPREDFGCVLHEENDRC